MTAGVTSNIEDDDTGHSGTHKEIEKRGHIAQSNLIDAPFVESNIILDDDTVNLDTFPSIIEIVKGSIQYNVSDVFQDVDSGSTLQLMSDAARYAKLDKKQHQAFQIIC
eukprot:12313828-Ditylum_brightwellii.AAC.1